MHRLFRPSQLLSAQLLALRGTDRLLIWISRGFRALEFCAMLLFLSAAGFAVLVFIASAEPSRFILWILPDSLGTGLRLSMSKDQWSTLPGFAALILAIRSCILFPVLSAASREIARRANRASDSTSIRLEAEASRDKALTEASSMRQLIPPPEITPATALKKSRRGL